ncbi:hypothetical protein [Alkalimarinus alittae]|uniref:Uncharacterized protein n=1 Tax=Alkalimarinus alittae TaxID=2961619 RepID=A0ABY6N4K1_9ALTE|nr:hypothetical protein [Alkalimarinus alittae]UZE96902.1 hypothetical protein NKI27_03890 [Alkalimarinus alittae]
MISWKALIVGLIVTILVGLFGQALYVLLASYIGMAASDYVFFSTYKQEIWFVFAVLVYCLTMAFGGLLTGTMASHYKVTHASVVGFLAGIASIMSSAERGDITFMAVVMVFLGCLFACFGGVFARRVSEQYEEDVEN